MPQTRCNFRQSCSSQALKAKMATPNIQAGVAAHTGRHFMTINSTGWVKPTTKIPPGVMMMIMIIVIMILKIT